MRIKLLEPSQRKFLEICKNNLSSPSVFSLLQFGINCSISSMKNYYTERRLLPEELFLELCHLAKIDLSKIKFERKDENWGKVKGGMVKK